MEVAWLGRERADVLYSLAEGLLRAAEACYELLVVLLGECLEVVAYNLESEVLSACVEHLAVHLQKQALLQGTGSYACRLELLNDMQYALYLLDRDIHAARKGQVVGERNKVAAQVAIVIEAADDICRYDKLLLAKRAEAQLLHEGLAQRVRLGDIYGALLVILREVVHARLVCGGLVLLAEVLLNRNLLGSLVVVVVCFNILLEDYVLLYFTLDALLELHRGELE